MSEEELENQYDIQEERDNTMAFWGTWIAGIALICSFVLIFSEFFDFARDMGYHGRHVKQNFLLSIAEIVKNIPEWLIDTVLTVGVTLVFANLRSWFKNIEKPAKIIIPTTILLFTSIAWIAASVYEASEAESAYNIWYLLDIIIAIECLVLGIIIATDESSAMPTWMIVYGVVNIGVTIWSNSLDEWSEPGIWTVFIIFFVLYLSMALMLVSIKDYLKDYEDDEESDSENAE